MDLKTLRDRTIDAINTIIRRDESTETGDLLQPCIEGTLSILLPNFLCLNLQLNMHICNWVFVASEIISGLIMKSTRFKCTFYKLYFFLR